MGNMQLIFGAKIAVKCVLSARKGRVLRKGHMCNKKLLKRREQESKKTCHVAIATKI